jgi:hypothetical protein
LLRRRLWRSCDRPRGRLTIAELVPVIASAPADARTRTAWLDRLFEAHAADQIPYIERLAEYWGELCGSRELASEWADRYRVLRR